MNGILPDSQRFAHDAAKVRAELASHAAREIAQHCEMHGKTLREAGANNFASLFEQNASTFRALERSTANAAGIPLKCNTSP